MSLQVSTSLRTTEGRWTLPFCSRLSRKENRSAVRPTCIASRSWGHRPCSCRAQPARASSHATASLEVKSTELGFARTFAEEYVIGDLLGAGSFGTVHACTHRKTGRRYAVKTISKRFNEDRLEAKFVRRVLHEVDIYQHLGGSLNVAYLYGAYEDDYCVDLVMELCEGGELWKGIKSSSYTESQAARIIREIVRTVAQCHAKGVVMRDVKPENFLFLNAAENSPLKAIDFGIAEYCAADQTLQDRAGTPIYVAPEVLKRNYGQKADLWSVGIVAYQLLTGRLPFLDDGGLMASSLTLTRKGFSNKDIFRAILYAELDFSSDPWGQRSSQALDFVKKLLCRDPARRPCAEEVLQHSWLAEDAGEGPMLDPMGSTLVQRLQRYGTYGKFKQTALRAIAHIVAVDGSLGTEALRREFERLDQDHDGHVTYRDVSGVLEREGYDLSQTETEQLLATLDLDCSGEVDSDNWLAALMDWEQLQHSPGWAALVEQAFVLFDADRSGRIGMHDLELLLCGAEGCRVPDTVNAVLREADIDHDGGISLDEFKLLMLPNEYDRLEFYESRVNPCRVKERLDGAADGVGTSSAAPS